MSLISIAPNSGHYPAIASQLLAAPQIIFTSMLNGWKNGMHQVWLDPSPQSVIDALGTNASGLFQLSTNLQSFLETQISGCTASTASLVQPYAVNSNGTITISGQS